MVRLNKAFLKSIWMIVLLLGVQATALAQTDRVEGVWLTEKKDAKVQIYKAADGKFYGKIIWLKDGVKNGKPKTDENNPKGQLKNTPLMGLMILKSFKKDDDSYED